MASTPILPLAVWQSGTNQNSIPANDNALRIEALNREIVSQAVTAQPASPADGDTYIVAATHTGAQWASFSPNDITIFKAGTWYAWAPTEGLIVNVAGGQFKFDAGGWVATGGGGGGGAVDSVNGQTGIVILALEDLADVSAATPTTGYFLAWNGAAWVPAAAPGGGGGLTGFTSALNTAAPNATINVASLQADTASENGGLALLVKGSGALTLDIPDNASGGNARGDGAIDLQLDRATAAQVASGSGAMIIGINNTASGVYSGAFGYQNNASGNWSYCLGRQNSASQNMSFAIGQGNTVDGTNAVAIGRANTLTTGVESIAIGSNNSVDGDRCIALGSSTASFGSYGALAFSSGPIGASGDAQIRVSTLSGAVGGVGPVTLRAGNTGGQYLRIPDRMAVFFRIEIVAGTTAGDIKTWSITGSAKRTGGVLSLVGTPTVTVVGADAALAAAAIAVTANNGTKVLDVEFTGVGGLTSYVNASLWQTEVMVP